MTRPQTPWADPNEFLGPAYDSAETPLVERVVKPAQACTTIELQAQADLPIYKKAYDLLYRRSECGWYDQDALLCRTALNYARLLAWKTPWHVYLLDGLGTENERACSSAFFVAREAHERLVTSGAGLLAPEDVSAAEVVGKRSLIRWARLDRVLDKPCPDRCEDALAFFDNAVGVQGRTEFTPDVGRAHLNWPVR